MPGQIIHDTNNAKFSEGGGSLVPPTSRSWESNLCQMWGGDSSIVGAPSALLDFTYGSSFRNQSVLKWTGSKIEAKFRTFSFHPLKLVDG